MWPAVHTAISVLRTPEKAARRGGGGCLKGAKHQAVRSTAPTCRRFKRPRATASTCAPSRQGRKLASRMSAARVESCAGRAARRSWRSWARSLRAASGANNPGSTRAADRSRRSRKNAVDPVHTDDPTERRAARGYPRARALCKVTSRRLGWRLHSPQSGAPGLRGTRLRHQKQNCMGSAFKMEERP